MEGDGGMIINPGGCGAEGKKEWDKMEEEWDKMEQAWGKMEVEWDIMEEWDKMEVEGDKTVEELTCENHPNSATISPP